MSSNVTDGAASATASDVARERLGRLQWRCRRGMKELDFLLLRYLRERHPDAAIELGWASHGCIGTPDAFVSRLFAIAKVGDRVIVTRGRTAEVGTPLA